MIIGVSLFGLYKPQFSGHENSINFTTLSNRRMTVVATMSSVVELMAVLFMKVENLYIMPFCAGTQKTSFLRLTFLKRVHVGGANLLYYGSNVLSQNPIGLLSANVCKGLKERNFSVKVLLSFFFKENFRLKYNQEMHLI